MPYIKPSSRERLESITNELQEVTIGNAGNLNYLITYICKSYLDEDGMSYTAINEVIGALECAKLEMYRRVAVPYETRKMAENGDVEVP